MITNLKSYPKMKDSGVPWLGEVPEHWEVLPNRAVFSEINEREHPDEQMLSVTITKGVVPQQALLENSSKKDSSRLDKSAYKLVRPGDIAYNKMRAWQGAIGVSEYQGIVSPAYVVQRPRAGNNARYLHYLLRTPAFAKEAERWSYGITSDMWSLRPEHFKMIYTCVPPPEEQAAIVRYLDGVDRKIRRFIRNRQRLIAVLKEQKQAIINQVVTGKVEVRKVEGKREKGEEKDEGKRMKDEAGEERFCLVPRPAHSMKPSGVDWLGDIPKGWEVRKLKYEMTFRGGGTPSKAEENYWNGTIPWVSPKDMKTEIINDAEDHITQLAVIESSTNIVPVGSILLVVRSGILQRKIPVAITGCQVALNQDMKALHSKGNLDHKYFFYLVKGCEKTLLAEWTKQGATVESIEHEFLSNTRVPIPPKDEQRLMLKVISREVAYVNSVINRAQREINLVLEYRTRLIADVVMGKVDVRKVEVKREKGEGEEEELEEVLEEEAGLAEE